MESCEGPDSAAPHTPDEQVLQLLSSEPVAAQQVQHCLIGYVEGSTV
jgi:hypothetical protein